METICDLDKQYVAHTYNRFPITLVSGSGSLAKDDQNKEYIDLGSGIGVTAFGFADQQWVEAVSTQLHTLQHTSNLYYTEPCVRLAQKLCTRTGLRKVFFANSGAEANECAIKVARKYASLRKGAEYSTIVTLHNSFHGRTLTTLAATGQEHFHELYRPLTPGFVHALPNDLADLKRLLDQHKVAGILLECIQGEGGVVALDPAYLQAVGKLAQEHDLLLMIDEVQSGNGRTGLLYSYMHFGLQPDVVTTAKGLGGGLPLGACLLGEKVKDIFAPGEHGSTFGGNPVSCAGAINILDRIDDTLLAQVREKSAFIVQELQNAPGVASISGLGFMLGIKPSAKTAGEVVSQCLKDGVLCLTAKDKVRLLPALNIPQNLLEQAIAILKNALKSA